MADPAVVPSPEDGHQAWGAEIAVVEAPAPDVPEPPVEAPTPAVAAPTDDQATEAGRTLSKRQQQINDLIRKGTQAEIERDSYKAEVERLRTSPSTPPAKAEAAASVKPVLEAFLAQGKSYEDWIDALTDWKTDQKIAAAVSAERTRTAEATRDVADQQIAHAFDGRVTEFKKTHADYDAVVLQGELAHEQILTAPMVDVIRHEPFGPALAYHFASHPDDARRIAALPPGPALVQLGQLGARLTTPAAPAAPVPAPVTRAAAPMSPGNGTSTPATDTLDVDFGPEFVRRGNEHASQHRHR